MNNIKKFRKEQNMKLKDLSQKTDLSVGYLCHLEKGTRRNPSIDTMEKVSKALNKSITETFFPNE